MSYFDDASLVMIPSGYKTSKVYSVKPTDGSGDLTFTRSNDTATRVNSAGLIEKVRTNLVLQSQAFENASWIKINATATANSTTAPDGTLTADTILAPLASATAAYQGISSQGAMTLSLYAKANTSNFISLTIFDVSPAADYMAIFDLSNGTFIGNGGLSSVDSYIIENAGNGWYRLSVTKNVGAVGNHNYVVGVAKTGNSPVPVAGTSVFVWGAQVEASDFGPTPYIPTTSAAVSVGPVANVPRLDYLNSSCPRLLLEPQRTNLVTYSEQLNTGSGGTSAVTANTAVSPDGYTNADTIGTGYWTKSTSQAAGTYTLSVFAKYQSAASILLYIYDGAYYQGSFNLQTGVATTSTGSPTVSMVSYGNGWYRCIVTATTASTISEVGFGSGNFYGYGLQLEAGAYATSYIPTLGAAVTRGADVCSKSGISSILPTQTGTLYVEFDWQKTPADVPVLSIHNNSTGLAWIQKINSTTTQGTYFASGYIGSINGTVSASAGIVKVAYAWTNGRQALYINGVQAGTATAAISDSNDFSIFEFNGFWGIQNIGTSIASALVFPTALSNSDLAALTA